MKIGKISCVEKHPNELEYITAYEWNFFLVQFRVHLHHKQMLLEYFYKDQRNSLHTGHAK